MMQSFQSFIAIDVVHVYCNFIRCNYSNDILLVLYKDKGNMLDFYLTHLPCLIRKSEATLTLAIAA